MQLLHTCFEACGVCMCTAAAGCCHARWLPCKLGVYFFQLGLYFFRGTDIGFKIGITFIAFAKHPDQLRALIRYNTECCSQDFQAEGKFRHVCIFRADTVVLLPAATRYSSRFKYAVSHGWIEEWVRRMCARHATGHVLDKITDSDQIILNLPTWAHCIFLS